MAAKERGFLADVSAPDHRIRLSARRPVTDVTDKTADPGGLNGDPGVVKMDNGAINAPGTGSAGEPTTTGETIDPTRTTSDKAAGDRPPGPTTCATRTTKTSSASAADKQDTYGAAALRGTRRR